MIWLKEKNILTKNKIGAVDDDSRAKLIEIGDSRLNGTALRKEFPLSSLAVFTLTRPQRRDGVHLDTERLQSMIINAMPHLISMEMIRDLKMNYTSPILLEKLYIDWQKDLALIESISQSPYAKEIIRKLYLDYYEFLRILKYLAFDPIQEYNLDNLRTIAALEQKEGICETPTQRILEEENSADINSQIITRSRVLAVDLGMN